MGPRTSDVLLSIGLFLGPPASAFVIRVCAQLYRDWRQLATWREDDKVVSAEGFPPGAPVTSVKQPARPFNKAGQDAAVAAVDSPPTRGGPGGHRYEGKHRREALRAEQEGRAARRAAREV